LQSTEKKITIFLSVGILEHSPLAYDISKVYAHADSYDSLFIIWTHNVLKTRHSYLLTF